MKDFLEFDTFFRETSKKEFIPSLSNQLYETIYLEMAEGGRAGGGRGGYVRLEEDDIQYLYQFLPEDWGKAIQWRYGLGLMLYSRKKNAKGLGQAQDFKDYDVGNINFSNKWLKEESPFFDEELSEKAKGNFFSDDELREYKGVKFGFNQVFKKLSDVGKYDFDMGQTDFSNWPELPAKNAGYKPLSKENASTMMTRWLKSLGMEYHHPANYQELINQQLINHPEVEKDESSGMPSHPNYSPLGLQHHLPITQHNYHDYLYRKLNNNFYYPSKYTQWHIGAAGGAGFDPSKDPHLQNPHPQAGEKTGQTHYRRTQYAPNMEALEKKYGKAAAAEIAEKINQSHDSDLYPVTQGQPASMEISGKNYLISPDDVSMKEYNYAADVASKAVGKTINSQDIVVKPAYKETTEKANKQHAIEYDLYDLYGLHRSIMSRERDLEHLFPEEIHAGAKKMFIEKNESKYNKVNGGAGAVFDAIYNQRFSSKPKYIVNPESNNPYPLRQVDYFRINAAYNAAGRKATDEQLLQWDKTGILQAMLDHKRKMTGDPHVGLRTIVTAGFYQTYSLPNGPEIWERQYTGKKIDGKKVTTEPRKVEGRQVFVPLLYPGQAFPSQKQRGKSVAIGAIGNSAVGEQRTAFFGVNPQDDKFVIPGTNEVINRNNEFFNAAAEGRLPDKRLFHPLNRPDPEPDEINRAHNFSYPELAKWQGKEIRKVKRKEVPFEDRMIKVDVEGKPFNVLASVAYGVNKAIENTKSHNPILAEIMANDIGNLYQYSSMILKNLVDHPQFWYNRDYENYLKGQEEERSSGDVSIPSEQSEATIRETGFMWRAKKVRDFIKTYAQRRWGHLGTRRKREGLKTISGSASIGKDEKGDMVLDTIAEDQRMSQEIDSENKRQQGERKTAETMDSIQAPANAQNSFFAAMKYSKWLKNEAQKGRYHESEIIQMDNKISSSIYKSLIMRAISSLYTDNKIVPSIREILQMPAEKGGANLSPHEAAQVSENDPRYEKALLKQENLAAQWAGEKAQKEIEARRDMEDPTASSDLLPKEFIIKYADAPIDTDEIVKINSTYDMNQGLRQTPYTNKAEEMSKEAGELDPEDEYDYKSARHFFKSEELSLVDTANIESQVEDIVDKELPIITAFRDHLLDDLAHNYYIKHHLDNEILEKIRDSATAIEEAGIDPEFKNKVEERIKYAIGNKPRVDLRSAGEPNNPYRNELKKMLQGLDPDIRDKVNNEVTKEVKKLSSSDLFNANKAIQVISNFKDSYKSARFATYAILDRMMNEIINNINIYIHIKENESAKEQLRTITKYIDKNFSATDRFLSMGELKIRFNQIAKIAAYKAKHEAA